MAAKIETMENDKKQYIVITFGNEQYGIDISYVDNIVRMQKITRVPKAQPYFKGVINLRLKMGLEDDVFTNTSRIIILKIEQKGVLGIIVDEVKEVVTLGSEEIDKVAHNPKDVKSTFINGIGKNGDDLISLFDISSVVDEKENS